MSPTLEVVLWWAAFAGSHLLMSSRPVRSRMVAALGERVFQGLYSLRLCRALNFQSVFIGAGQKFYIEPHHAFVAGNRVGHDCGVGSAEMRRRIHVVERGREVKSRFRHKG